ncbi:hypothetical protein ACFFRR_005670 [Megaselia abdita]
MIIFFFRYSQFFHLRTVPDNQGQRTAPTFGMRNSFGESRIMAFFHTTLMSHNKRKRTNCFIGVSGEFLIDQNHEEKVKKTGLCLQIPNAKIYCYFVVFVEQILHFSTL